MESNTNSSGLAGSMADPPALCGPTLSDSSQSEEYAQAHGAGMARVVETLLTLPSDPQEVEVAHKLERFGFEKISEDGASSKLGIMGRRAAHD